MRIIADTNRDLKAAVAAGTFRSDLLYRTNVFSIAVPPLGDRRDDIPLLVEYLTERYASKAGKKIKNIHKRTLELFQSYDWPGNIRELQNMIERAVILCDGQVFLGRRIMVAARIASNDCCGQWFGSSWSSEANEN